MTWKFDLMIFWSNAKVGDVQSNHPSSKLFFLNILKLFFFVPNQPLKWWQNPNLVALRLYHLIRQHFASNITDITRDLTSGAEENHR